MRRLFFGLSVFAALALVPAVAAPAAQKPAEKAVSPEKNAAEKNAEWTEAESKAARDRQEAREREWDRKMKALAGSICTGC